MDIKDLSKLKIDKTHTRYRQHRRKKSLPIVIAFLCVLGGFIFYKTILNPSVEVKVSTVAQVYPSQSFTLLNASGYVVAQRKASVASKITGRLEWLGVEEGSSVRKGQVIAKLEGEDAVAAREQAIANLSNAVFNLDVTRAETRDAELHYNRQKELHAQGVVSQSEFDIAEARHSKAKASVAASESAVKAYKAALHLARVVVRYAFIRAPFDAVVLTKNADVGDIVAPLGASATARAAVVTIADMDSLLVEADVSESNLQKVTIGQPCEIQLDALPETRFRGVVHMIVPTADRSKASVMVKVKFLDKDCRILPEMSAKVAFLEKPVTIEEQKPRTAVHGAAIIRRNNVSVVFRVNEGRLIESPVTTGIHIGDMIEIVNGVKSGDKVAVGSQKNLRDGMRIKVKEK